MTIIKIPYRYTKEQIEAYERCVARELADDINSTDNIDSIFQLTDVGLSCSDCIYGPCRGGHERCYFRRPHTYMCYRFELDIKTKGELNTPTQLF